jgi:predicted MPP superfamily phosphohydrolase
MEHRFLRIRLILISFTVITDILFYLILKHFLPLGLHNSPLYLNLVFWIIPMLFVLYFLFLKFDQTRRQPSILANLYTASGLFLTIYLPKIVLLVFHLTNMMLNLVWRGLVLTLDLFLPEIVTYRTFHFITYAGLVAAGILFLLLVYGALIGRFSFKIEKVTLGFANLPVSFHNFRIVQISDIHLGSWYKKEKKMTRVVELINGLTPDLILFTGDLVNNFSEEADGWHEILEKTKAKYGKYSILGNHDYGDYWDWKSEAEKGENMQLLYKAHQNMDFRLLLNQSDTISINGHTIGILGVENWGKPPFEQYGDLQKAIAGLKPVTFKILLSHDPSHWQAEVHEKTDIDLTLSGHTHAMQFGFKVGRFQWSPVKYMYKLWSGLYGNNGQYLYVNRGLGSLGFPGRIGMRPEITLIKLVASGN